MAQCLSLSVKYKNLLSKWCKQSSSHGLPKIFETKYLPIKIMWTIFFIASMSYCTYFIIRSIVQYTKYETNIKIIDLEDTPTIFPTITICNTNPFNRNIKDYINKNSQSIRCWSRVDGKQQNKYCSETIANGTLVRVDMDSLQYFAYSDDSFDANYYGFPLKTSLNTCSYNLHETCNDIDEFFLEYWDLKNGLCYKFNHGKLNKSLLEAKSPGYEYGLSLELIANDEGEPELEMATLGFTIKISNPGSDDLQYTLKVPTGAETYVAVSRESYKKLGKPYSSCLSNFTELNGDVAHDIINILKTSFIPKYSQSLCNNLCFELRVITKCGCHRMETEIDDEWRFCKTEDEIACYTQYRFDYSISNEKIICDDICLPECEFTRYTAQIVSMQTYPTENYVLNRMFSYLLSNDTDKIEIAKLYMLKVIINFDSFKYQSFEEIPAITIEDLLGNIGGQLGLFVGISLLSIAELFELLIEALILTYEHYS